VAGRYDRAPSSSQHDLDQVGERVLAQVAVDRGLGRRRGGEVQRRAEQDHDAGGGPLVKRRGGEAGEDPLQLVVQQHQVR